MMPTKDLGETQTLPPMTEFSCFAQGAHTVCLAGTFNAWNPEANPMSRDDGNWRTDVALRPGRYEYKFVVDGTWCCRPGCHDLGQECVDCVRNDFDTMNRVIEVC
jgi:1,4-alpha-glucan branching enzyme